MARPKRTGLDYFPLDVTAGVDDEIELIEAEYGLEGFAIFVKLLQKIYKNGYYIEWTEKEQLQFSKRVNVDINRVNVIIMSFLKWGLLDKIIFEQHKVLTSKGIQKRFLIAIDRRTTCEMYKEYLLLGEKEVNAYKNLVIVYKTPLNVCNNPQIEIESKVKESKEKEESSSNSSLPQNSFKKVIEHFQNEYISFNQQVVEDIKICLSEGMSVDLMIKSTAQAKVNNKSSPSYATGICKNWLKSSIKTLEDLERRSGSGNNSGSDREIEKSSAERIQEQYQPRPGEAEEKLPF